MKATDLMIGDWVQKLEVGGHYRKCRIKAIIDNIIDCVTSDGEVHTLSISGIESITLTAEILINSGFESQSNSHFYFDDEYTELDVHELTDSVWFVECEDLEFSMPSQRIIVCNVHELQHALKLCGIDKEIEL